MRLEDTMIKEIRDLRLLPDQDKEALCQATAIDYRHGMSCLPKLSIFCQGVTPKQFGDYQYDDIQDCDIFFAGLFLKSNLSVFVDEQRRIYFHSRFYLTHLRFFIDNIDSCLFHIHNLDLKNFCDVGSGFVSIEKWFKTYGHFKDEAYQLGDFLYRHPDTTCDRVLLDYPTDNATDRATDFENFQFNPNYMKIDKLIFGDRSLNSYSYGNSIMRLRNLKLVANGAGSKNFHSFPKSVYERIRDQVVKTELLRGPDRIFISRSASHRDIGNKSEVESRFAGLGFENVNPESITYEELVHVGRSAKIVVMYYGSALTNMVYFSPGTKIFILKSKSYLGERLDMWNKVIERYGLNVTEILSVDNIITDEVISALNFD